MLLKCSLKRHGGFSSYPSDHHFIWSIFTPQRLGTTSYTPVKLTYQWNIPAFWWYLRGKNGDFTCCYVSLPEGTFFSDLFISPRQPPSISTPIGLVLLSFAIITWDRFVSKDPMELWNSSEKKSSGSFRQKKWVVPLLTTRMTLYF